MARQYSDEQLTQMAQQMMGGQAQSQPQAPQQYGGILGGLQKSLAMLPSVAIEGRIPKETDQYSPYAKGYLSEAGKQQAKGLYGTEKAEKPVKPVIKSNAGTGEITSIDPSTGDVSILREGTPKEKSAYERRAEMEIADRERADTAKAENIIKSAQDTLNTIKEVESGMGNFGMLGGLPSIPGTSRVKWEANINKLLSGKIIDLMGEMKNASRTGATGFGQLSEKELKVLQDSATALKRTMNPNDAQEILNEMKLKLSKIIREKNNISQESNITDDPLGLFGE